MLSILHGNGLIFFSFSAQVNSCLGHRILPALRAPHLGRPCTPRIIYTSGLNVLCQHVGHSTYKTCRLNVPVSWMYWRVVCVRKPTGRFSTFDTSRIIPVASTWPCHGCANGSYLPVNQQAVSDRSTHLVDHP